MGGQWHDYSIKISERTEFTPLALELKMNFALRTVAAATLAAGLLNTSAAQAALGPWDVYNNFDQGAAFAGGPFNAVVFTLDAPTYITEIYTFHLNIENTSDVIGVTRLGDPTMFFNATSPGLVAGFANLMDASINVVLDAGTYIVTDELNDSWAFNAGSDFAGMTEVMAPEPASMAILGIGLAGLGYYRRRR